MAVGPGSYNAQPKFGDDARDMTIGLARKSAPDNNIPGPGYYQHERADGLVKPNAEISLLDLQRESQRFKDQPKQNLGPGSYEDHQKFGDEAVGGHIFDRKIEKIAVTPGPGTYSPEKAD